MKNIFIVAIIIIFAAVVVVVIIKPSGGSSNADDFENYHPKLKAVRKKFMKLNPRYGDIPLSEGDSAYTENKSSITLCLVDPDTGKVYDNHTITYVALHELAHCVTNDEHGHGEKFKENFRKILKQSAKIGIFDPTKEIPQKYCGVGPGR